MASAVLEVMYERHATLSSVRRWTVRIAPTLAERHPDLVTIEQVVEG